MSIAESGQMNAIPVNTHKDNSGEATPESSILAEISQLDSQLSSGLLYTHHRANANTRKTLEVASFAYALIELLAEKGLITVEELDERKRAVAERLAEKFRD